MHISLPPREPGDEASKKQTTLGEGTSSSTVKKRSSTREEKLKVVHGQESATLSATTGEARGMIRLCLKMETAYLPWLYFQSLCRVLVVLPTVESL